MRFLEKFFLFLFSLCLAALGVGGIWACYDANLLRYVNWLATMMTQNRWITLIASACVLLLAILLLFGVVFHSSGRKRESGGAANVIMVGDANSSEQISTAAVDCIIQQQKKDYAAVKELESKITQAADGVQIMLKVVASAEANIPELANSLQNSVKTQLENMVGLKVNAVKIIVADVVTDNFTQNINTDKQEPTL